MSRPSLRAALDNFDDNDQYGLTCPEPTLTQQQFAEEADINYIVKRFGITGQLPTGVRMPTYQDFEGIFDYHSAMNSIARANEAFDRMPANVRSRFQNDPAKFVEFCSDENNREEAIKLGLVAPKAAELVNPALNGGTAPKPPAAPTETPKKGETPPTPKGEE